VFSTTIAKSGDQVWAELYSSERCAAVKTSTPVSITLLQGIDAGKVGDDQEICHNATPKNLVQTQPAGNLTGMPEYSWSTSVDNQNWTADLQQKGQDYDFGSKTYTATTYFRRTVSDPAAPGACNKAVSEVVKVTVYAPQEAGAIASPQELCEGNAISPLTDSVPASGGKAGTYTYTWEQSISPTGPFEQLTGAAKATYTSTALLSETTYYRRKVGSKDKQGNSCATDSSNVVEVKVRKNKDISVTLNDTVACQGRTAKYIVRIVANGGTNPKYKWYYDNELQTSDTNEFSSDQLANGKTVRVEVTSDEQCTSLGGNVGRASSTTNIVDSLSPEVTLLAAHDTCQGGSSTVTIATYPLSPNNTYEWYLNGLAVSTTKAIGIEGDSYVASGLKLGENRVRVKVTLDPASPVAQCATRMDTVSQESTIRVYAYPTPVIRGGDTTICVGDTLSYRVRNGGGQVTWYRDGKLLAGNADSTLRVREGGSYHAVGASGGGLCRASTDTVEVKAIPVPVAKAGIDKPYALEGEVVTLIGSGGGMYSWSPAGLLSDAKAQGPTFVAKRDTVFTLTVTDSSGLCESRDSVRVFVERPIVIVNTFTPNGDGVNDRWVIRNIESFPRCLVKIYNRWGNLVWESTGYASPWDGTNMHNGQVLPDGTYFYIIELHSTIFRNPFQGWVQVIR
jgi:gliding motility-associated-like protein